MLSPAASYDRYVLPRLIDFACGMGDVMKQRSLLVPRAHGRVLEIGLGTGLNLGFYDAAKVSAIVGVDPARKCRRWPRARRKSASRWKWSPSSLARSAPRRKASTPSCTFTLCPSRALPALGEMRRVLKRGGELLFCEHGRAPDASVLAWQRRLTPWWKPLAGGCHLDRDMPALLREAGFRIDELEQGYLPGPRPMTYVPPRRRALNPGGAQSAWARARTARRYRPRRASSRRRCLR